MITGTNNFSLTIDNNNNNYDRTKAGTCKRKVGYDLLNIRVIEFTPLIINNNFNNHAITKVFFFIMMNTNVRNIERSKKK